MKKKFLGEWLGLVLLYVLFSGKGSIAELCVGSLAALSGVLFKFHMARQGQAIFRLRLRQRGLFAKKLIPRLMTEYGLLTKSLWWIVAYRKRIEGKMVEIPFDGGGDDEFSATRRAWVIAGISLCPNSIALDINRTKNHVLIHQLFETPTIPGSGDKKWPL